MRHSCHFCHSVCHFCQSVMTHKEENSSFLGRNEHFHDGMIPALCVTSYSATAFRAPLFLLFSTLCEYKKNRCLRIVDA